MKYQRLIASALMAVLLAVGADAAIRAYGAFGTATDTNTQLTVPFSPREICITNSGATNVLYADISGDGVATTASASTNFQISIGARKCFDDLHRNPSGTFLIGLICAAAVNTTYQVEATY